MSLPYITKHIKIRALHDDVIVTDMNFGEMVTSGGIVVQSDDAKVHGIKPRWGRVYCVGPEQTEIKVGQWILIDGPEPLKLTTARVKKIFTKWMLIVLWPLPMRNQTTFILEMKFPMVIALLLGLKSLVLGNAS
jgi:co-chaperonin GroES (HSP10)